MSSGLPSWAALVLLGWAHFAGSVAWAESEPRSLPVTVARAQSVSGVDPIRITGVLEAERRASIGFYLGGVIKRTLADVGDDVAEGDALAALVDTTIRARYERAVALEVKAQREFDRALHLREQKIGSLSVIDDLETDRRLAHAELQIARHDLEQTQLVAPFAGKVSRRLVEIGETVAPGDPAFELVAYIPHLKAVVGAPARTAAMLRSGDPATIRTQAYPDLSFQARVERVGIQANHEDGTFNVELEVENPDGRLLPGMVVRVEILGAKTAGSRAGPAVAVPSASIVRADQGEATIFVVTDGRAESRTVALESILRDYIVVRGALKPGEEVVVRGASWVREGDSLRVVATESLNGLPLSVLD